jgi:hemoglobin-like flavoprotein
MELDLHALETSFDLIAPRGEELMDEFYARLFEAAPVVIPLFAGTDLKRQKAMLLGTLVLLRKSLRNLDAIVPSLRNLGARHVEYGARPEHYPVVGEVLIGFAAVRSVITRLARRPRRVPHRTPAGLDAVGHVGHLRPQPVEALMHERQLHRADRRFAEHDRQQRAKLH